MPRPRSAAGGRLDRSKRRRRGRQSCSSQNDVIDLSLVDRNQTSNMGSQAQRRPDRSRRRRRGIQSCSSQDDVIDLTLVDGNQNSDLRSQPQRRRNHQRAPRRQRPEVFSLDVTYSSDESDELQVDRTPEKALIQPFNFILTPSPVRSTHSSDADIENFARNLRTNSPEQMSSSLKTTTPNSTEEATRRYDSCSDSDIEENIFATCYKEKRDVALASALKNLNSTKKRKAVKENITEIERCNENIKEKRNLHQKNGNSLSEDSQELDISFDLSNVKLSRSQQKRLKKDNKKAEMAADELFKQFSKLEAEAMQTTYIIDDDIIIDSDEEDLSALLTLFIRWESKLFRWTMRQFQKFATVYQEVAERFSVNVAQVLLCYNDKVIHPDSCPKDLKLSVGGIIEGGIQSKPELYKNLASTSTIRPHSPDAIPLKVQNADRKGTVTVYIKKQDKMIELMHRYVEAKNLELAKLRFSFDGTPLDPRDTPETLDLEGDECIDVYMI